MASEDSDQTDAQAYLRVPGSSKSHLSTAYSA